MGECEESIVLIISYLPQIEACLMTIVVSLNTFETSSLGASGVFRTDRDGDVEFATDGTSLWVRTEL
jgi:hypothetical protein